MEKVKNFIVKNREVFVALGVMAAYMIVCYALSVTCLIKHVTGVSCPGCGITRALFSLATLDIPAAVSYNPAVFVIVITVPLYVIFRHRRFGESMLIVTLVVLFAVYLYRMFFTDGTVVVFRPEEGLIYRLLHG